MQRLLRGTYWLLAGGLIGFGLLTFYSIGLLLALAGVLLSLYGFKRSGSAGAWLAIVSMGALPALWLALLAITADPKTTFFSPNYPLLMIPLGLLVLAGLLLAWAQARKGGALV